MHHTIFLISLISLLSLIPPLHAQPQPPETLPLTFPVLFTRNDGQWDESIRFAVLHQSSEVSLRSDGIDLVPPGTRPRVMPDGEVPRRDAERIRLRFVEPSPEMRVVGTDTAETAMHFYYDGQVDGGIEHVPTFRNVKYENVWENCDVEYYADGENLRQRMTLYPGANPSDIRFTGNGLEHEFRNTRVVSGPAFMEKQAALTVHGSVIAMPYTPGVLRDTIVLETEFRTFFGSANINQEEVRNIHPMPDGAILLGGRGKAPEAADPRYIPPQDGMCGEYDLFHFFLAEFTCDGRALRFCTHLLTVNPDGPSLYETFQVEREDTTGYFLLINNYFSAKSLLYYTPGCSLPERPPVIDTAENWKGSHIPKETWLGRISRDGTLTIGTHIWGVAGLKVLRARDRSVLLAGVRGYWPAYRYPPFRHYTRSYATEHPGVLLRLNERCDSVLFGVNLSFFGDTVRVVSIAELSDGSVALAGTTRGEPMTHSAWQSTRGGMRDVFLARLGADLETVLWSTFLGGDGDEYLGGWGRWECSEANSNPEQHTYAYRGHSIMGRHFFGSKMNNCLAVDADDGIWLTGTTLSSMFIEMPGMQPRATRGSMDMFLARFDRNGQPTMIRAFGGEQPGNVNVNVLAWKYNGTFPNEDSEWALNLELLPCDRCIVYGMTWTTDFPLHDPLRRDPWELLPERWTVNTFAVFDKQGSLHFSSPYPGYLSSEFRYSPTGHLHLGLLQRPWHWSHYNGAPICSDIPQSEDGYPDWGLMRTYNAYQSVTPSGAWPDAMFARHYLPLCGEDAIACSFSVPDTIRRDSTRGYLSHEFIPLDVTITNPDPALAVFDVQAELRLPPGIVVEPQSTPLLRDVTPMLAPGDETRVSWQLRVLPQHIADTLLPVTVVTHYRWADRLDNCLSSHGGCSAEIVYLRHDSREPELQCDIDTPPEIGIAAGGTGYVRDTIPVRVTVRNTGAGAVLPGEARLRVTTEGLPGTQGVRLLPVGAGPSDDGVRALPRLQPQEEVTAEWLLSFDRRGHVRDVLLEAEVHDAIGRLPVTCSARLHIPALPALHCDLTAPVRLTPGPGGAFPAVPVELLLGNIVDTLVRRAEGEMDLSGAPHLAFGAGEEVRHYLGPIASGSSRTSVWQLRVSSEPPDSSRETVTVWYWYQEDTTRRACTAEILLLPAIGAMRCGITAPDALTVDDSLLVPMRFDVDYVLENIGNAALEIDRHELRIPSDAGLTSADPVSVPGGRLNPAETMTHSWRLRALALAEARRADLTVLALDANDSVLSTCVHGIAIPGIDGLRCALTATDTVRFERTPPGYVPSFVPVSCALRNVLDEAHTNIEAVIDLTQAPRFSLDASETVSKTIAMIDSHTTADLTWQLIPQPAPRAESQEIVVRYRSEQMAAWQECRVTVFIEAWPEEATVTCVTGGHDSLYADSHYEQFIPDPLHVSYTVTNTGTVALTGCEASIILPPEFALAGADSTQRFTAPEYGNEPGGPVPEGTILPNASCTRWWKITPTQAIADTDPKQIRWQWTSDEQGKQSGCDRTIHIIPDNPESIVLTPLHLYFEAEHGGTLPAEQHVQLWTGGGLAMPWTAQPSEWWLDAVPASGDRAAQITVQPLSTMLGVGAHGAEILLSATPENRRVAVTYVIRKSTGIGQPHAAPGALTLDAWPQPVPSGTRLHVLIGGQSGETVRLTLHDLLGRERLSREVESDQSISIDLASTQLTAGVYLLRAVSENGAQAVRMVSVVR